MSEVRCVDGSVLSILTVPKRDRGGVAYEVTLRLLLDGAPFGEIGECSGWRLAHTAERLRAASAQHGPDAFPVTDVDVLPGVAVLLGPGLVSRGHDGRATDGRAQLRRLLPRDDELLCLRSRDPDDGDGDGQLRLWLRHDRTWLPGADGVRGRWSTTSRAVLDCWGDGGRGVRCLLDAPALLRLLDGLVADGAVVEGSPAPV